MWAYRPAQVIASLAIIVASGGLAAAQSPPPARDSLTLYQLPDYRGASVTFYGDNANIGSTGFTDKAQSAQVVGAWRLCTGGGFRGRCELLTRNTRNLDAYGLSRQVGSAQRAAQPSPAPPVQDRPAAPRVAPPPAADAGPSGAAEGLTATFFARPSLRGLEVSAQRVDAADLFCRTQDMSIALYFDRSRTADRAIEADGRVVGPVPVLRDVLCRRN